LQLFKDRRKKAAAQNRPEIFGRLGMGMKGKGQINLGQMAKGIFGWRSRTIPNQAGFRAPILFHL
jgi:hypothetical protein